MLYVTYFYLIIILLLNYINKIINDLLKPNKPKNVNNFKFIIKKKLKLCYSNIFYI